MSPPSSLSPHSRPLAALAAISGGLVVIFGAFGAHGLHHYGSADLLPTWQTGVRYHMFHSIAALLAAFVGAEPRARRFAALAGWSFVAGIVLFSGSLYMLVLAPQSWLAVTAPLGGLVFMAGWGSLAASLLVRK